jgi:hypothetical protein
MYGPTRIFWANLTPFSLWRPAALVPAPYPRGPPSGLSLQACKAGHTAVADPCCSATCSDDVLWEFDSPKAVTAWVSDADAFITTINENCTGLAQIARLGPTL